MGHHKNKHHKCKFVANRAGELVVSGQDQVEIKLGMFEPSEVYVDFEDEENIVPCNPQHFDGFSFELHYKWFHYVLVIKWNVSAVREIVWAVRD